MSERHTAMLKRVYRNTGQNGKYLGLMLEIDGEGVRANLFDEWYFEEGTDHDISQFTDQPVNITFDVVERDDKIYRNTTHIEPAGETWVKPEEGMGERKPGPRDKPTQDELMQDCETGTSKPGPRPKTKPSAQCNTAAVLDTLLLLASSFSELGARLKAHVLLHMEE